MRMMRTAAPMIDGGEAAILAEARSLIDWHDRHRFCARCGTPSVVASGGWVRHCPECKAHHFPRVDPVVIMLAEHGDREALAFGLTTKEVLMSRSDDIAVAAVACG